MTDTYRIFGSEMSPYSQKVRAWFRYKGIPHEWLERGPDNIAEYQKYAKLPLVPLVITPEPAGMQDSTPILEKLEAQFPEPSIHPQDPAARFISALLEEFGDEWGNKWMFHYRWHREVDQISAAERLAGGNEQMAAMIRERMVPRVSFVGSSDVTTAQIEDSYQSVLRLLEAHLASRPYLMGRRPAFADFGVAPQLQQALTDPTAGGIMRETAPAVAAWSERMLDPKAEGDFEALEALLPTLEPLLELELGRLFLPWSDANAAALAAGQDEFSIELDGRTWTQQPQKYHAKSLAVLRARYAEVADKSALDPILERTGCRQWLAR
jgi:glutathione S-transferase